MTDAEIVAFLRGCRHSGKGFGRWVYAPNAKPIIDELEALGLMRPAFGEFIYRLYNDGRSGGCLVSLYTLTTDGSLRFGEQIK